MDRNHHHRLALPPHPLREWRLAQRVTDAKTNTRRVMTLLDAAALAGVSFSTWNNWERWPQEGGRIPRADGMQRIVAATKGKITAEHFYPMMAAA